jgi:ubiquinone/menaquinone biosynthesis C-methylase UbiE
MENNGFQLDSVVPWGRSLRDYKGMFGLNPLDLQQQILDCAGGPASFNAELTRQGGQVISCDPLYQYSARQIATRIDVTYHQVVAGVAADPDRFVWQEFSTPEEMGQARLKAMRQFLTDLPWGLAGGRYQVATLPKLPFANHAFDLALCGHFLFCYSNLLSLEFHQAAIAEMCRVAREVRIFPVVEQFSGKISSWLEPVIGQLQAEGYLVSLQTVDYEFQKGGNQMLKIDAKTY